MRVRIREEGCWGEEGCHEARISGLCPISRQISGSHDPREKRMHKESSQMGLSTTATSVSQHSMGFHSTRQKTEGVTKLGNRYVLREEL